MGRPKGSTNKSKPAAPAPTESVPETPSDEGVLAASQSQASSRTPRKGSKAWLQTELDQQTARAESLASREMHLTTSAMLGGHGAKALDMLLAIPDRALSDVLKIHNDLHGTQDTIRLSPEEHVMVGSTFTTLLEASNPDWLQRWGPALLVSTTVLAVGVGKILLFIALHGLQKEMREIEERKKEQTQPAALADAHS